MVLNSSTSGSIISSSSSNSILSEVCMIYQDFKYFWILRLDFKLRMEKGMSFAG